MNENEQLCPNCFMANPGGSKFCLHCGQSTIQDWDKYPYSLPYGTALGSRYITGRVLGQGGFGITYCAYDIVAKKRVAIKEFFPDAMASRGQGHSVIPFTGQRSDDFQYGKNVFLEEAKTLAQFIDEPGIVHIYSYFEEFCTAYFAMEYIEGCSLQSYLEKSDGHRISWEEAKALLIPVMDALMKVHAKGIIHRDIKPDNIYILNDKTVKVLDFGSARYSMGEKSRSLDVVLTHGFAPREQYSRHGRQGPYTDVYALAATFYYAVTGKKPQDSIDRMDEDNLASPGSLGARIPPREEDVLLKALAVEPKDRYQSMQEFKAALNYAANPGAQPVQPQVSSVQPQQNQAAWSQNNYRQPQQTYSPPASQQPYARPQQTYAQPQPAYAQPQQTYAQPRQAYAQPPVQPAVSPAPVQPAQKSNKWLIPVLISATVAVIAFVLILVLPGSNKGQDPSLSSSPATSEATGAPATDAPQPATDAPDTTPSETLNVVPLPSGTTEDTSDPGTNSDLTPANAEQSADGLSGVCGANLRWAYSKDSKTLTLSGSGAMFDYDLPDEVPWYRYASEMRYIEFPEGLTHVGNYAFYECYEFNVNLPDSCESIGYMSFAYSGYLYAFSGQEALRVIGNSAFWGCSTTENVYIYSDNITIEEDAFTFCSKMKFMLFTGAVSSIGNDAFYDCTMSIYYPNDEAGWDSAANKSYGGSPVWVYGGANGSRYKADKFSIILPESWVNGCETVVEGDTIYVYHTASKNAGCGGFLFGLALFTSRSDFADYPSCEELGTIEDDSTIYYIVAIYPTDVQTNETYMNAYMAFFNEIPALLKSISGRSPFAYWY